MLVMSRREGESILIGDAIEIVIAHLGRSRVKVGIRAPREVSVVAGEWRLVREENLAAAQGNAAGVIAGILTNRKRCVQESAAAPDEVSDRQDAGPRN